MGSTVSQPALGRALPRNPLVISELLSPVLSLLNTKTLKSCRLVSKLWNEEAGYILPFKCWIKVWIAPIRAENYNKIEDLQSTLDGSSDPSRFFGRLQVYDPNPESADEGLSVLFQSYGRFLNAFSYNYSSWTDVSDSDRRHEPSSYMQYFIFKLLSQWSPRLEEFRLTYYTSIFQTEYQLNWILPRIPFDLDGPLTLKRIKLKIESEIEEPFQDFLIQLLQRSPELKWLQVYENWESERLFRKIANHKNITKQLKTFEGHSDRGSSNTLWNFKFSPELRTLTMEFGTFNLKRFQRIIDSVKLNLTTLNLKNYPNSVWGVRHFQQHIFKIVVQKLRNLKTLNLKIFEHGDAFFSNANNLTDPPHTNLKRVIWAVHYNNFEQIMRSLTNLSKWFPHLTHLGLTFGAEDKIPDRITFYETIKHLIGLKMLKDLYIATHNGLRLGILLNAFFALRHIPSLQYCTLEEYSREDLFAKIVSKELKDSLLHTGNPRVIRLIGFRVDNEESVLKLAKKKGVTLEVYDRHWQGQGSDTDEDRRSCREPSTPYRQLRTLNAFETSKYLQIFF